MDTILEAKNLTKRFPSRGKEMLTAVDNVSFTLGKGETLGIVGGSGCGKSTVAKLVTRLITPTAGEIFLAGKNLTAMTEKELRPYRTQIQMVFQMPVGSFDPRRTLGSGIGEALKNKGVSKTVIQAKTGELLERVGLSEDFAKRYPHEVSGGQCQRAAIARALIAEPSVVVCDEATSGLDVTAQKQVMTLLEELRREKKLSYLFICHNLALVQEFCDRVLVMCAGRIIEEGTPDEMIMHPKQDYTKLLVDSVI